MKPLSTLVAEAKNGNAQAFGQIVSRFQDMAYASAYAYLGDVHLAQDVAQDAFLEAYQKLGGLRQAEAFPGWFRRIVVKHSDRQVRNHKVAPMPPEMFAEIPTFEPDPLTIAEHHDVRQAVASLPEGQRVVTTLFHLEGYSQKEISDYLELPISTIKKRLFDARKRLKERMFEMATTDLKANKPSNDDAFTQKVQFFIAMQNNDLKQIQSLLKDNADLAHVKTEWAVASYHDYWPLNVTPIFFAAATGNLELVTLLLDCGAEVNEQDRSGKSPLHDAVAKRESEMVDLLLDRDADLSMVSKPGYTPLHIAVLGNNFDMAQQLITRGADVNAKDTQGRTAADWAALKGWTEIADLLVSNGAERPAQTANVSEVKSTRSRKRKVPAAKDAAGRYLDESGQAIDAKDEVDNKLSVSHTVSEMASPILETGIKIIDLCAPLKRGGINGLFTPLSGVGKELIGRQVMSSIDHVHDGYIVYLVQEREYESHSPRSVLMQHRESGLSEQTITQKLINAFAPLNATDSQRQRLIETGFTLAQDLCEQGHEVLVVVESIIALTEGVLPYIRAQAMISPQAAITTLIIGDHSVGVEPEPLASLDGVIAFNYARAKQSLYPAIDPLESYSTLFESGGLPDDHVELVNDVRRLLKRYEGLHNQYEYRGYDGVFYFDDRKAAETCITRGRRLLRFLTQPLPGLEVYGGNLGLHVTLEDTLKGCREILEGKHDALPEEAFQFKGTIEHICESV